MHADTSAVSLAFQQWLKVNGVRLGEIELSSIDASEGRGSAGRSDDRPWPRRRRTVLSTASSAPGSLIARVPDGAVLTVSSSSASESLEAAGLGNKAAREEEEEGAKKPRSSSSSSSSSSSWREAAGLALALLVETRLGEDSRFAPYVRWLLRKGEDGEGEEETRPVTWDPRAAALLFAGTAVAPRLLRLPPSCSAAGGGGLHAPSAAPLAWSRLARPWLSRVGLEEAGRGGGGGRGGRGKPERLPASSPSLRAEFLRCLAVVSSHAFVLGEDQILALVPVFDALDHAPGPPRVQLSHSGPKGGAEGGAGADAGSSSDDDGGSGGKEEEEAGEGEREEGSFLEMRSTAPLSRGQEVLNSYGRLSTTALARRYGFAVADRAEMLRSGDERLEVGAGEVGAAAAAVSVSLPSSSPPRSLAAAPPLRAPAACLRAAAASRGRALFVSVPGGEPSLGLLLAVRASLSATGTRRRRKPREEEEEEEEEGDEGERASLVEGRVLLEVARRRRAALEAGGWRAARALAKLGTKRKRGGGGRSESEGSIEFPPASGFELAAAVRRSELEGCTCLESWVKRRM